jgi:cysteinyl-tRNA synthetase
VKAVDNIKQAMYDDLDTPRALATIDHAFATIEQSNKLSDTAVHCLNTLIDTIHDLLGIDLHGDDISNRDKELIAARETARNEKNWTASDQLRDKLAAHGISLRDTPHGAVWHHSFNHQ